MENLNPLPSSQYLLQNMEKGILSQVASISANNDEVIGTLIADAMKKVGKNGVITVEEAKGTETEVKTVKDRN